MTQGKRRRSTEHKRKQSARDKGSMKRNWRALS